MFDSLSRAWRKLRMDTVLCRSKSHSWVNERPSFEFSPVHNSPGLQRSYTSWMLPISLLTIWSSAFEDPDSECRCWTPLIPFTRVSIQSQPQPIHQILSLLWFLLSPWLQSSMVSTRTPKDILLVLPAHRFNLEILLVYNLIRYFPPCRSTTVWITCSQVTMWILTFSLGPIFSFYQGRTRVIGDSLRLY